MVAPLDYSPRFEEMKRYVRFGEEDARLLSTLCGHAKPHFEAIVRDFYERAREHEEAHRVFESEAQIARLHSSLIAWLTRLLTGPYDEVYCAKSARIGEVHVRVGLPQHYTFTAMNLFRVHLQAIAVREMGDEASAASQALSRIIDIELAIMNQTFHAAFVSRLERIREHTRPSALSERRYQAAAQLANIFVVGLDAGGAIRMMNQSAERLTGYRLEELVGIDFVEAFLEEDAHGFRAALDEANSSPEGASVELGPFCSLRTRTGRLRDLSGKMSRAEPGEDGVELLLVARDVTDDRAAEATRTRTEKLAAVGTMAAGLAHEIRNPLNGARLHLTYMRRSLKRNEIMPDLLEAVDVVSCEVSRLSALVNDFLAFARPARLRYEPTVMQRLCERAMSLVQGQAEQVTLKLQVPQSELVAMIDPGKTEQVLLNLLTNAVDAAADVAAGEVTLALYRAPHKAIVEVLDNGKGFDAKQPVFDAFFSTKSSGTGLGLAIVHRIVDDHGGGIEYSSSGGSTRFRVSLPLRALGVPD